MTLHQTTLTAVPRPPATQSLGTPAKGQTGTRKKKGDERESPRCDAPCPPPGASRAPRRALLAHCPRVSLRLSARPHACCPCAAAPPVEYDLVSSTEVIGTATLRCGGQVLDGATLEGAETLDFRPPPHLFDERGVRLALKDARHPTGLVGSVEARVQLHV